MAIALVFSITWLPLNVYNLFMDLYNPFTRPEDEEKMAIIYATCHLFGMSSACANPFLYGWFNDNFRTEFICIFMTPFQSCFGNNDTVCFCSCQAMSEIEPSSNAFIQCPIIPSDVIETRNGIIENNHQSATNDKVEGTSDAVISALNFSQSERVSSKIDSFTMTTAVTMEEVVSKPVKIRNDTYQTTNIKVDKQYSQSPSSFLKPRYLETHL